MQQYLILSNAQGREFETLIEAVSALDTASEKELKDLIYNHGNGIATQAVLLYMAWEDTEDEEAVDFVRNWQAPSFPLTGADVKEAGVQEGPAVGKILAQLETWWLDQGMIPDREVCLDTLKIFIRAS